MRVWSHNEINTANEKGRFLIIVDNKIYDIEFIINNHPGGNTCLLNNIGNDCSKSYQFHSYKTQKRFCQS